MPTKLPLLLPSQKDETIVQETAFSSDVVGRYICNTWDEAVNNGGLPFDAIVIGAGMFGAYCAEKIYRNSGMRVLVLDAGCLLVTEHVQNLSRIGITNPGPKMDANGKPIPVMFNSDDPGTREWVWGIPWRSSVPFPGLGYCLGGRSIYWGGWAPRLLKADLEQWPKTIREYLQNPANTPCPDDFSAPPVDEYCRTEKEIGAVPTADYISGKLYDALKKKAESVKVDSVDAIEDAPLAVQASAPASGLFSFDKWSSAPIFVDAVREDADRAFKLDSQNPNWSRRLFYVPRVHVSRLQYENGRVTRVEAWVNGQKKTLDVNDKCAVVLANGTIESTRLALESFPTPLMGRNLMAHLRTNIVVRIHRSALGIALTEKLMAAALLVRGSTAKARYHLQVTAAAMQGGSEDTMWRAIPDIELLDQTLASQKEDWIVVTFRAIGEMIGNKDATVPKVNGSVPSWMDLSDQTEGLPVFSSQPQEQLRRAWVNLVKSSDDETLWKTMDDAAFALARKLADDDNTKFELVEQKRDGLGTTHHEAGTLWMGEDSKDSVTNLDGRFHHVQNAWVAGPAIFPTLGSANPSLTALTLARRTALAIVKQAAEIEADFMLLGTGGLAGWRMSGGGSFMELGGGIIEARDGFGLLWYTKEQFDDFILRADFRINDWNDNSGIYIRVPALGGDPSPADTKGYEIQIDNTGKNSDNNTTGDLKRSTGAIYKLAATSDPMPAVGQWHTFEIEAVGPRITVRLNGKKVSEITDGDRQTKGYIGLQNHHSGSKVQFKRLRIRKLTKQQTAPLVLDGLRRDINPVIGGDGRRKTRPEPSRETTN